MRRFRSFTQSVVFPCLIASGILTAFISQGDEPPKLPPASKKEAVTYEGDIRPLFERSCTKCHGDERQKAKLRLDSREAAIEGAGGTAVIKVGDSAKSKLVILAAHASDEEDDWMPPEGKAQALTPEEIGLVRAWIDQGAK